jgi:hypothetical protein
MCQYHRVQALRRSNRFKWGGELATYIDHVRCGKCDAGLTLEAATVVLQRYRRQPWLRHFWVRCDICVAPKLYWPTPRQVRLAGLLNCHLTVDDFAPDNIIASYGRSNRMPAVDRRPAVTISDAELGFLLSMLAATSGPAPASGPRLSYLPPHWAN